MKFNESTINNDFNKMLNTDQIRSENITPEDLFKEYKRFYETESFLEAFNLLSQIINKGFPAAEFEMGKHHYFGSDQLGITKDYLRAFEYFSDAVVLGHTGALYYQGMMYLKGLGVALDLNQALHSLNTAATQGEIEALNALGKIYQFGYSDILPDDKKAESYYKHAIRLGYPPSMLNLAVLLENQLRFEEAYELIIESAKQGYMGAIQYGLSTYK
ncbi:sel1 repeat family protein [Bacillus sp. ISL-18]|uniref:tetratricopeptide repeat protein n=1 Tax=Bacillus sp. ISL-18 TaxID=2819118 RepID=UPI001BE9C693|nr:tetratricopeptide repeat protein [Bacillus sp. ISL-18]MBT2654720.1 sel1 repeat family protein [Bacillus sp. ISL-18]